MLRFLTAGESHGRALITILEGIPSGLTIDFAALTAELRRRQGGYGRGRRMVIESDRADAISGVRHGVTTGAPIALMIPNKDWENWQRTMAVEAPPTEETPGHDRPTVTRPRPGHVDLAGVVGLVQLFELDDGFHARPRIRSAAACRRRMDCWRAPHPTSAEQRR